MQEPRPDELAGAGAGRPRAGAGAGAGAGTVAGAGVSPAPKTKSGPPPPPNSAASAGCDGSGTVTTSRPSTSANAAAAAGGGRPARAKPNGADALFAAINARDKEEKRMAQIEKGELSAIDPREAREKGSRWRRHQAGQVAEKLTSLTS